MKILLTLLLPKINTLIFSLIFLKFFLASCCSVALTLLEYIFSFMFFEGILQDTRYL